MVNVLVRDLPEEIHSALQRQARRRGQSLQAYLVAELSQLAERPALEEVLERISSRSGGRVGLQQAASDLAEDRERR